MIGKVGINDLPPTSHTVHAHIHRGLFLIYNVCNFLNPDAHELDPAAYCFEKTFGILVPMKSFNPIPERISPGLAQGCGIHLEVPSKFVFEMMLWTLNIHFNFGGKTV